LRALLLALLLGATLAAACSPRDSSRRARGEVPDVVLIVIDTIRTQNLSSFGHGRATSPALDALARKSARFTRAYSQAPWTTPSVASLLTSRYPTTLGIRQLRSTLPQELLLLPELLHDAGWTTGAVVSHDFCSSRWGFDQGYDFFDDSNAQGHAEVSSPGVTELALRFLEDHEEDALFLFLHYFDPHYAYVEHEGFEFPEPPGGYHGPVRSGMVFRSLERMAELLNERDIAELLRIYDSEVAFTDHWLGRVLDRLRAQERFENAIVVVTGDHGEAFLEHGALGHTRFLYEELVNVPLLLKLPGMAPRVVERPVELVDVYPTILDALGMAHPPGLVGRSLLAEDEDPRPVFTETSRTNELRAVIEGNTKLILDLESERFELYELASDPGEQRDLADSEPERAAELVATLREWMARVAPESAGTERELSPEERERLRALGYAD
jgi:arylsulfatase A-like enzyme